MWYRVWVCLLCCTMWVNQSPHLSSLYHLGIRHEVLTCAKYVIHPLVLSWCKTVIPRWLCVWWSTRLERHALPKPWQCRLATCVPYIPQMRLQSQPPLNQASSLNLLPACSSSSAASAAWTLLQNFHLPHTHNNIVVALILNLLQTLFRYVLSLATPQRRPKPEPNQNSRSHRLPLQTCISSQPIYILHTCRRLRSLWIFPSRILCVCVFRTVCRRYAPLAGFTLKHTHTQQLHIADGGAPIVGFGVSQAACRCWDPARASRKVKFTIRLLESRCGHNLQRRLGRYG